MQCETCASKAQKQTDTTTQMRICFSATTITGKVTCENYKQEPVKEAVKAEKPNNKK